MKSFLVNCIEIDRWDRKWIGTENSGISVLDDGGTIFDKSDDDFTQGLTEQDGLLSNTIRAIAEDQDGVIWIGTDKGLNFWYGGEVGSRAGAINDDIKTIAVDALNNKWIGTSGGISVLAADGYAWTHYTTENSSLVSSVVTSFAFNEMTGEVFIGTTNGLSCLETPPTAFRETLNQVKVYPNPLFIDQAGGRLTIENLAEESTVRMYTVNGLLVRNIPKSQSSRVIWDGKNDRGELVSSGIYIIIIYTDKGMSKVGKVAVIRK